MVMLEDHKKVIRNATAVVLITIVWLVTAEVLVRSLIPLTPRTDEEFKSLFTQSHDAVLNYEMQKNFTRRLPYLAPELITYSTNRQRFRGQDYVVERNPGRFRIAVIGDSITFGIGVQEEETYSAILGKGLRALGIPVEVYNFGVGGYNTIQEQEILSKQVLKYSPDILILGYALNDADPNSDWSFDPITRRLALSNPPGADNSYRGPLGGRFAFLGPFLDQSQLYGRVRQLSSRLINSKSSLGDASEASRLEKVYSNSPGSGWAQRQIYLKQMASLASAADIKFLVAIFPVTYQFEHKQKNWVEQSALGQFFHDSQINSVDLLPVLQATNFSPDQLFLDAGHFTKLGHTLVAQSLMTAIFKYDSLSKAQ